MKGLFDFIINALLGWFVTCIMVMLIMMCFGQTFSWSIGTGVWLAVILTRFSFSIKNNK